MKRCPKCRRDYYDDSLIYCLDDGASLVDGPSAGGNPSENPTKIHGLEADKEPATVIMDRPVSEAGDTRSSKRWFVLAAAVAIIVTASASAIYYFQNRTGSDPAIRSVAVLPLDNLSGDASQEFFADGMTEALIGNLSQVRAIKVISRTSVMRYKRSGKSIPEIARELGVDGVIEGSVQRSDGRVRVTAQLIHAATDSPIWSRSYERNISDILMLQSEIAQALVSEISAQLSPREQQRLGRTKPIDPAATEALLLGWHYLHKWTRESERLAVEHLQKAVTIEPEYAEAWAALADAWQVRSMVGDVGVKEAEQPARTAALKALELEPDTSAAHVSMCFIYNNYDFNWTDGERACRRGIELGPNNAKAHFAYAYMLARLGRWDEMSANMEKAMQLDPAEPWWPSVYGSFLIQARRFQEAEKRIQRAIAIDPEWAPAYRDLIDLHVETGRFDEALNLAAERGLSDPLTLSYIYARKGDRQKASELLESAPKDDLYDLALAYAALDDLDRAFEVINRSLDRGEGFMFGHGNYLVLDRLKTDPRWNDVLKRMNLPQKQ